MPESHGTQEYLAPSRDVLDQKFPGIEAFGKRLEAEGEPGYFWELDDETKAMVRKCLKDSLYKDYFVTIACQHIGEASKPVSNKSNHKGRPRGEKYWCYEHLEEKEAFDLGWDLHLAPDLITASRVLRDVRMALALLFLAGRVHRDISPDNIPPRKAPTRKEGSSTLNSQSEFYLTTACQTTCLRGFHMLFVQAINMLFSNLTNEEFLLESKPPCSHVLAVPESTSGYAINIVDRTAEGVGGNGLLVY
ncbi:hypothetical protein P691DRAFT_790062 [Macrolepiota fuliginosa MF-IS2]|uniref:Fungal-type protein kinase domain-containing protein n=1 Tax=Macrolepiota fuliginosa MF-IS2 TaxID=1400762 RepID=A0A9P5X0P6_9AGAR|nr:hypothetical protein P691DRAFT_790062 [Macrolepiota fuliginosa MF-IS2]